LFFLRILPILESLSNKSPSIIDTVHGSMNGCSLLSDRAHLPSSTIKTLDLNHLDAAFLFFLILLTNSSALSMPRPIPAKEWIVTPPILQAAMPGKVELNRGASEEATNVPVEAVMATASSDETYFLLNDLIISLNKTDFPVPDKTIKDAPQKINGVNPYQHYRYKTRNVHLGQAGGFAIVHC
jgi:hypothetical protein